MSTATIRAALVDLVSSVEGVGKVHAYERFASTEAAFLALYRVVDNSVRGWNVRRLTERRRLLASGRDLVTQRWLVTGLVSLVDADQSAVVADALADAIVAAEREDPTLSGAARGRAIDGAAGMQITASGPVMFAGVLCHQLQLQLDVQFFEGGTMSGGLDLIAGASGRLVGVIVDRLAAVDGGGMFEAIEGRIAWDRDDEPGDVPAAIVVPVEDRTEPDPATIPARQRVDRSVAVIVVAPTGFPAGHGALAAGGLEVMREKVRDALHGWGDGEGGVVDFPLLYAGGAPIEVPPGLVAWREVFTPAILIEG